MWEGIESIRLPEDGCSHSIVRAIIKVTGFPGGAGGKESASKAGDTRDSGSIPGWGRSLIGGHGNSLQYSCLGNPMDTRAWQALKESDMTVSMHTHIIKVVCGLSWTDLSCAVLPVSRHLQLHYLSCSSFLTDVTLKTRDKNASNSERQ